MNKQRPVHNIIPEELGTMLKQLERDNFANEAN